MLRRFFNEILERRVVPWLLAYLAGAWVVIEATQFLTAEFGWPGALLRILPVAFAFGVPSAVTLAWFHGRAGWQRVKGRELAIHGAVVAALAITLWAGDWSGPGPTRSEAASWTDAEGNPSLRRIAVLYFKDHTGGELSTFSQDLTEGLVHELAQIRALDVLPLAAVARYRDTTALGRIVRELGVGTVVEGSASREGDSVRVTAQLVDAVPETHLGSWVWTVGRRSANLDAREVAREAADSVRSTLGDAIEVQELESSASSPEALALYRQAREIYEQEAVADWTDDRAGGLRLLAQADSLLAAAETLDPDWSAPPLLRSAIAANRSLLSVAMGTRNLDDLQDGIRHADRALRAGSDSAAALEQRGRLRFAMAEYSSAKAADSLMTAAERDLRGAIRIDERPQALMALSDLKEREGSFRSALTYAQRAVEADAFLEFESGVLASQVSNMIQLKELDGARSLNRIARRRFPHDQDPLIYRLLILGSEPDPGEQEIREGWAAVDTLARLGLTEREWLWRAYGGTFVGGIIARAGMPDSADAVFRRARKKLRGTSVEHAMSYQEAHARLVMEQTDSALVLLRDYVEAYPSRGASLLTDWWFEELWNDPRFLEITGTRPVKDSP